jgi:hypothetical protein
MGGHVQHLRPYIHTYKIHSRRLQVRLWTLFRFLHPARVACSAVRITAGYGLDGPGSIRSIARFFLSTASRPALGPTQPPIQWVLGALSPGVKQSMREADHSPTSRMVELYLHSPIRLHGKEKSKAIPVTGRGGP